MVPFLLVVVMAELFAWMVEPALPLRVEHSTRDYDAKIDQMDLLSAAGGVDVVFAGTSQVMFSVDPDTITQASGTNWTVYNAAVPGATPVMNRHWILQEVVPRLRPKTVLYGLGPLDLFRAPTSVPLEERYFSSRAVRDDVFGRLDRWLADRFTLVRHRETFRSPETLVSSVRDRLADRRSPSAISAVRKFRGMDDRGHADQFDGKRFTTRLFPIGPSDLIGYHVSPDVVLDIEAIIQGLRSEGVDVILMSMPMADEIVSWLPNGRADADAAARALQGVAARAGVPLLDLASGMSDEFWFADPLHLNRVGASAINAALSAALVGTGPRLEAAARRLHATPLVSPHVRQSGLVVGAAQHLYPNLDLGRAGRPRVEVTPPAEVGNAGRGRSGRTAEDIPPDDVSVPSVPSVPDVPPVPTTVPVPTSAREGPTTPVVDLPGVGS